MKVSKCFLWIERIWCVLMALSLIGLAAQFAAIFLGHSFNFLTISMCVWIVFILGIIHFPITIYFLIRHHKDVKKLSASKADPAPSTENTAKK